MDIEVKQAIMPIMEKVVGIFKEKKTADILQLRQLSDMTTHNSSIYQDEDSINIAILILSLSKIMEKSQPMIDYDRYYRLLSNAYAALEEDDYKTYEDNIKNIFKEIKKLDTGLKSYIKSQISKGYRLYEHGISAARSAEMLGISEWELLSYAGKGSVLERSSESVGIRERLKYARGIFG